MDGDGADVPVDGIATAPTGEAPTLRRSCRQPDLGPVGVHIGAGGAAVNVSVAAGYRTVAGNADRKLVQDQESSRHVTVGIESDGADVPVDDIATAPTAERPTLGRSRRQRDLGPAGVHMGASEAAVNVSVAAGYRAAARDCD